MEGSLSSKLELFSISEVQKIQSLNEKYEDYRKKRKPLTRETLDKLILTGASYFAVAEENGTRYCATVIIQGGDKMRLSCIQIGDLTQIVSEHFGSSARESLNKFLRDIIESINSLVGKKIKIVYAVMKKGKDEDFRDILIQGGLGWRLDGNFVGNEMQSSDEYFSVCLDLKREEKGVAENKGEEEEGVEENDTEETRYRGSENRVNILLLNASLANTESPPLWWGVYLPDSPESSP